MSVRDLLIFNLFLHFTDKPYFISGFRAWGGRSESCGGRCNSKLGNDLRTNLQQNFGVPTAAPDICAQTQTTITGNSGIDRDGLGVRVRHYCVWELCDRIAHFPFAPLVMDKIQIWVDPGGMQNHPDNLDNLS